MAENGRSSGAGQVQCRLRLSWDTLYVKSSDKMPHVDQPGPIVATNEHNQTGHECLLGRAVLKRKTNVPLHPCRVQERPMAGMD